MPGATVGVGVAGISVGVAVCAGVGDTVGEGEVVSVGRTVGEGEGSRVELDRTIGEVVATWAGSKPQEMTKMENSMKKRSDFIVGKLFTSRCRRGNGGRQPHRGASRGRAKRCRLHAGLARAMVEL
jgi:hypothetical protein